MTRDEINSILPGFQLDTLIAEKVMGFTKTELKDAVCPECGAEMYFYGARSRCTSCNEWRYSPYREYSFEIDAAWDVVTKIFEIGYPIRLFGSKDDWACTIRFTVHAKTVSLAICRAALLTVLST